MESAPTEREITCQTMEVDHEKETVTDEVSIDDLPNEILLIIFRNMSFRQLLRASAVNHRWNELAFFLIQDRVSLRLGSWAFETPGSSWTHNRTYTTVACHSTFDGFDQSALVPLSENVRKLELIGENTGDSSLLHFLHFFKGVETLLVKFDRIVLSKSATSFQRKIRGLLPSVRHLTLRCRYVRMVGLLAEVAPRLATLNVELLPRVLHSFIQCRFDCLQSLTLRFKFVKVLQTWYFPGKLELIGCLRQIKTLQKLGLFVDSDRTAFDVAFSVTSIEELALGGNFKGWESADFKDLSKMINLRSLSLDMEGDQFIITGLTNPSPTVEKLKISGPIFTLLSTVIATFPNLKVLDMTSKMLSIYEMEAIASSTWQNSMEDLSIKIQSSQANVVSNLVFLHKLKRLRLKCNDKVKAGLAVFNVIVSMDTLKELHIGKLRGTGWWKSAVELADCNRACAVFINERPTKFYERHE